MNAPVCPIHNLEAKWREGVGAKGPYGFWACAIRKDQNNGQWCSHKFPKPEAGRQGAAQRFNEGVASDDQKSRDSKKDETITRIAIAKSLIEAGKTFDVTTVKEFHRWVALVEGRSNLSEGIGLETIPPVRKTEDEIKVEDIPF